MVPPFPQNVRFATPDDLPRLALVATAGYVDAPQFSYMQPNFHTYPGDTVAGYQAMYRAALLEPKAVVLVAEAELNVGEKDKVCEELKGLWPAYGAGDKGRKVVVAASSLELLERCQWVVRRKEHGITEDIPPVEAVRRDANKEGLQLLGAAVTPLFKKNLVDRATISTMVLHPAYRGKRIGDELVKWIGEFFAEQGVGYYLAATPAGKKLYLRHGAREVDIVEVPGYSEHRESFSISFCEWDPPAKN